MLEKEIIGGVALDDRIWLLAVTEKKSKEKMDQFVANVVNIILEEGSK